MIRHFSAGPLRWRVNRVPLQFVYKNKPSPCMIKSLFLHKTDKGLSSPLVMQMSQEQTQRHRKILKSIFEFLACLETTWKNINFGVALEVTGGPRHMFLRIFKRHFFAIIWHYFRGKKWFLGFWEILISSDQNFYFFFSKSMFLAAFGVRP